MRWVEASVVFLSLLLGVPVQAATVTYGVDVKIFGVSGHSDHVTGSIVTDGSLGQLQPGSVLGWHLTDAITSPFGPGDVRDYGSDTGLLMSWTDGALAATDTRLVFDWGPAYWNFLSFGGLLTYSNGGCGLGGCGLYTALDARMYTSNSFCCEFQFFPQTAHAPWPTLGSGIPGLLLLGLFLRGRAR